MKTWPIIAIIGHPNEGKSSVLSTLTEDDSVVVSDYPGETIVCQHFPVKLNSEVLMEFVDTPGFQNPVRLLSWMRSSGLTDDALIRKTLQTFSQNPDFHHDMELLKPLDAGAGVIYVADCSRPLLEVDEAEMEILRLVNRPRMAVINYKEESREFLEPWKQAFRRHFNVIREFNAHRARFDERIALLETLKAIHQEWEPALNRAILTYRQDWEYRKNRVVEEMVDYLAWALRYKIERSFGRDSELDHAKSKAVETYRNDICKRESAVLSEIRRLYRHHIFDFKLPDHSILQEDLFSDKTWQVLGLDRKQLVLAAAGMGAGIGAAIDVAASGITFGVFTATGALLAGGSSLFKGKELTHVKVKQIPLGGSKITIGPNQNPQFPFVLLDRVCYCTTKCCPDGHMGIGKRPRLHRSKNQFLQKHKMQS